MVIMTGSHVLLRFSASSVISVFFYPLYHYITHDAMSCCIKRFPMVNFTQK